ncbi:hypothetical protein N431DRAFT_430624 [Stipitochalara longipes BDJ]|nr:hypothetical protein N431DRAFT_430624 [Stipitochalara longipes BDJ]
MPLIIPPDGPWTSARSPRYSLHPMPLQLFEALEAGDLPLASSVAPPSLPSLPLFLITEANRWLWRRRLALVASDQENIPWLSRLVVYEPEALEKQSPPHDRPELVIVGRIGFHEKPDERGMVEVGYAIDPEHRRKGHARAALKIMIQVAKSTQGVNVLRASVAPDNLISRRIVEGEGLKKVGQEMHGRRGVENIFEIDLSK